MFVVAWNDFEPGLREPFCSGVALTDRAQVRAPRSDTMGIFSSLFGGGRAGDPEARRLIAGGALLLDVRSPEEFASGHVEGALNIPVQVLPRRLHEVRGGRSDGTVVVYCRSGMRSASAARILRAAGFTVHDAGGMSNLQARDEGGGSCCSGV
jgi:rhodanese-related sulfurtransferase